MLTRYNIRRFWLNSLICAINSYLTLFKSYWLLIRYLLHLLSLSLYQCPLLVLIPSCLPRHLVEFLFLQPSSSCFKLFLEFNFEICILQKGSKNAFSDWIEVLDCQLRGGLTDSLVCFTHCRFYFLAEHRCFQGETVYHSEFIPDYNTSCVVFEFLLGEDAFVKFKNWLDGGQYFRQESRLSPRKQSFIWSFVASIDKSIHLLIMAMQVTKNRNSSRLWLAKRHIILQKVYLWMHNRIRFTPPSIQIEAG